MKKIASTDSPGKAANTSADDLTSVPTPAPSSPVPSADTNGKTKPDGEVSFDPRDVRRAEGIESGELPDSLKAFDPSSLRLDVNFGAVIGATKHLLTVEVRKATKFEWVQCSPDPAMRLEVATLTWKDDHETVYVVGRPLWSSTPDMVPTLLVLTVNTQGIPFFMPLPLPQGDRRQNEWHRTRFEGAQIAMQGKWVRFVANQSLGGYEVFSAIGDLGPPSWPSMPFEKLLETALRDRIISDRDHPVLRRMRGEV